MTTTVKQNGEDTEGSFHSLRHGRPVTTIFNTTSLSIILDLENHCVSEIGTISFIRSKEFTLKFTTFWHISPCRLRFRSVCFLHHKGYAVFTISCEIPKSQILLWWAGVVASLDNWSPKLNLNGPLYCVCVPAGPARHRTDKSSYLMAVENICTLHHR
jgi:hypothetical protein